MLGIVGGHGQGELEAVFIACFLQQCLCLFNILGVVIGQLGHKVAAECGEHAGADGHTVAVQNEIGDCLLVHGIAQCLTDAHIGEGLEAVVQIHGLYQLHGVLFDDILVFHALDLVSGHVCHQINGAALQAHDPAAGFHDQVVDLLQLCLFTPVIVKAFHDEVFLRGTGYELKGSGADGCGCLVFVIVGNDGCVGGCQICKEFCVGCLQRDFYGAVTGLFYRLDAAEGTGSAVIVVIQHTCAAGNRKDNIVCSDFFAVVEFDAFTYSEHINSTIFGNFHFLSDCFYNVAVGIGLYKAFENVKVDFSGSCRH